MYEHIQTGLQWLKMNVGQADHNFQKAVVQEQAQPLVGIRNERLF